MSLQKIIGVEQSRNTQSAMVAWWAKKEKRRLGGEAVKGIDDTISAINCTKGT